MRLKGEWKWEGVRSVSSRTLKRVVVVMALIREKHILSKVYLEFRNSATKKREKNESESEFLNRIKKNESEFVEIIAKKLKMKNKNFSVVSFSKCFFLCLKPIIWENSRLPDSLLTEVTYERMNFVQSCHISFLFGEHLFVSFRLLDVSAELCLYLL